jgi:hypothetical protein
MRKPTSKEKFVMQTAVDGLKEDIEALCNGEVTHDILGTMDVNLTVLTNINRNLRYERETTSEEGSRKLCPYCGHPVNSSTCQQSHP